MLHFNRMKNVVVQKSDEQTYLAHGVLEDHIYAMEVTVAVKAPELTIIAVDGKINRYTTHRCPPGTKTLPAAVGLTWHDQITSEIKKQIGRPGCRHLAAILAECLESVAWAVLAEAWEAAGTNGPADKAAFIKTFLAGNPQLAGACQALRP
jgi:hypothetical protein